MELSAMMERTGDDEMTSNDNTSDDKGNPGKLFKEFLSVQTLHGFRYLFETKGLRRLTWIVFFIISLVSVIILFRDAVDDYCMYKTYSLREVKYDVDSLNLPTITICDFDYYNRVKYDNFPVNITLSEFKRVAHLVYFGKHGESEDLESDSRLFKRINISSWRELIHAVQLNHHDVLVNNSVAREFNKGNHMQGNSDPLCRYDNKICNTNDIEDVWFWDGMSMCIQFNGYHPNKPPKNVSSLAKPFMMYMHTLADTRLQNKIPKVRVYLSPYGVPHQLHSIGNVILRTKLDVEHGFFNFIAIDYVKVVDLPPPYGQCGEKKLEIIKEYPYSKCMCILDCLLNYVYKRCGCIRFDYKSYAGNIPICNTSRMIDCHLRAVSVGRHKLGTNCSRGCPRDCVTYKYNAHAFQRTISPEFYPKVEKMFGWTDDNRTQTLEYLRKNILGIRVGYRNLDAVSETVTPSVSISMLLGTIGGSIGLALGFSLLTLVEFFLFTFDYAVSLYFARQKTKKNFEGKP